MLVNKQGQQNALIKETKVGLVDIKLEYYPQLVKQKEGCIMNLQFSNLQLTTYTQKCNRAVDFHIIDTSCYGLDFQINEIKQETM